MGLDADGVPRCVAINQAACEIAGSTKDNLLGKTAKQVFEGDYGQKLYDLHLEAFMTQRPVFGDYDLLRDGQERRIRTVLNPVFDESGQVVYVIGAPQDITAEHAVRVADLRSAQLNKEMEKFISLAAHDLRSPMRKVNQIGKFLREDLPELNESNSKLLDMLESVASNSFEMISDLISHAQASNVADDQESISAFHLQDICKPVFEILDPGGVHHWRVTDSLIVAERAVTQTLIRNLVDNAIKHNDKSLTVDISASKLDAHHFEVVISDNGVGFPDAKRAYLEEGGISVDSGFGLAGVRRLITSRGGRLSVDEPGIEAGATVRATLSGTISH